MIKEPGNMMIFFEKFDFVSADQSYPLTPFKVSMSHFQKKSVN